MPSLASRIFPEMYALGEKPPKVNTIDERYYSMPTPAYGYGWVVSSTELFEAFYGEPCPEYKWFQLTRMEAFTRSRISAAWREHGYANDKYRPVVPRAVKAGNDYVMIYMACNGSAEIMDDIMANKKYHDACREALGNPETMKLEPAWFRGILAGMPQKFKELGAREK